MLLSIAHLADAILSSLQSIVLCLQLIRIFKRGRQFCFTKIHKYDEIEVSSRIWRFDFSDKNLAKLQLNVKNFHNMDTYYVHDACVHLPKLIWLMTPLASWQLWYVRKKHIALTFLKGSTAKSPLGICDSLHNCIMQVLENLKKFDPIRALRLRSISISA